MKFLPAFSILRIDNFNNEGIIEHVSEQRGDGEMTQAERRNITLGAVRSYIRENGANPVDMSAEEAWQYLDNLAREEPLLIASKFYLECSENQWKLFRREWKCWRRENRQ